MTNDNIIPHKTQTSLAERMRITGSRPIVYWMSGLSGSGKSTIAALCESNLCSSGKLAVMLDGDSMRTGLCSGLGFSEDGRRENLRRIAECAKSLALSGQVVIVCTISPTAEVREAARNIISPYAAFKEVYVEASLELCAKRDPKGLYKKAFAGEIKSFTGIDSPYEIPTSPDITLDTSKLSAEECAKILADDAICEIYSPKKLISDMIAAAILASDEIMKIYDSYEYTVELKFDKSPVTTADIASNTMLVSYFSEKYPEYSILAEESEDDRTRLTNNAGVFIIDPIDGTKEFIKRNGEFCVSIGFAHSHRVVGGVIAVPAKKLIYYGFEGMGSYKITFDDAKNFEFGIGKRLHVSDRDGSEGKKLIMVASRSHMDEATQALVDANRDRIGEFLTFGSCLKGCMIAEGLADIHYRYGDFMKEWDTAAMQLICQEAGAIFALHDGTPITANREDPYNRHGFMILNRAESALLEITYNKAKD